MRSLSRLRARTLAGERGFTMVEMMVALLVLTVGIFSTAGAFMVSLKVQATSNGRARGAHIASEELESMAAIPYAQLGFASSQTNYRATFDGSDTVVVASPGTTPTGTTTQSGQAYSIRRDITWATVESNTQAYKRLVVQVSWTDTVGSHNVRLDGAMYPNGSAAISASASASASPTPTAPGNPTGFSATVSTINPSTQLDLVWTAALPFPPTGRSTIRATAEAPGTSRRRISRAPPPRTPSRRCLPAPRTTSVCEA